MNEIGSIIFNWFVIGLLLFSNGFFVAAEFSIVSVRKTRITQLTNEGNFSAKLALEALKDLDKFIAAVQLGVTISSIGLGWVGEATLVRMVEPLFEFLPANYQLVAAHSVSVAIAFSLITVLHVVIGELVPKSIALQYPERTSLFIALPMKLITKLFDPLISALNGLGGFLLKLLKIPPAQTSHLAHSIEELNMLINASYKEGVLDEAEKEMLHNVFKFSDLTAKQVMVPRTDMACIPSDISIEELNALTMESQYTRYPVYEENLDHISGIIHAKDLYGLSVKNEEFLIEKILRPVLLVPETITMNNLVREFKKRQSQMAIVIDEFGGTSGLITLEDVLEEIFGEVQDEFDEDEEADIKEISENTYLANAMMRLDEITEFFNVEIIDEDVDTIGGLVVKLIGRIAQIGDVVEIRNLEFKVKEIDGARVTKLVIVKKPPEKSGQTEE
ncbi:MAG: hemolysin family protein [Candidatus Gastranaerophilaceae bacterium]